MFLPAEHARSGSVGLSRRGGAWLLTTPSYGVAGWFCREGARFGPTLGSWTAASRRSGRGCLRATPTRSMDAGGGLVLPGAVDAHYHLGIYRDITEDARSETLSSLAGGVTSIISYFRTGSHYLEKTGPYAEIFPEVLEATQGHSYVDYGYHLAPMAREQVAEIGRLVGEDGVASFKYYMFYKGLDLSGSSSDAAGYTMSETYDLGHLFEIMEAGRQGAGWPRRRLAGLALHPLRAAGADPRLQRAGAGGGRPRGPRGLQRVPPDADRAPRRRRGRCARGAHPVPGEPAAPLERGGFRRGARAQAPAPGPRRASRDHAPPPGAHLRDVQRPARQGQPAHQGAVRRRRPVARRAARRDRLGLLRPRLLLGGEQGGRPLAGPARVRRHRPHLPVHADGGTASRPLARARRRPRRHEPGPRLRPVPPQGGHGRRRRRRPRHSGPRETHTR